MAQGHEVTFFTSDRSLYHGRPGSEALGLCREIVETSPFDYDSFERQALCIHQNRPFDAIVCLIDIRLVEASRLAKKLGLRFLSPQTAALVRDKYQVRQRLAACGIVQPEFELATSNAELSAAVEKIGFPLLIKPCDGYGSQNIVTFRSQRDFEPARTLFANYLPCRTDYGLGVRANDRLLVERFVAGVVIGVETFTLEGKHRFLGINDKVFFPPPFFAIRGSSFPASRFDTETIRDYVFSILDAIGFDFGAAHTEVIVAEDGLYLVEVNARLIGAKIPRLLGLALGRSVYSDVVNLHLGILPESKDTGLFAASRWVVASEAGILREIVLPEQQDPAICAVEMLKKPGDWVRPPFDNTDRLGYVMAVAASIGEAERIAEEYSSRCRVLIDQQSSASLNPIA